MNSRPAAPAPTIHYGRTHNPWNTDHISGGSSGGSAACVAARAAFGALGGDAGGSIRIPAAMCGVIGLKPTFGRVSRAGTAPRTFSVDCTGPLTRTAEDCALMLQAIAGHDPRDPTTPNVPVPDYPAALRSDLEGVRVGVATGDPFDQVEPEIARLLSEAHDSLRDLGAELVDVAVPDVMRFNDLQQILGKSEAAVICGKWMRERPGDMTFDAISVVQEGLLMPAARYLESKALRAPLLEAHVRAIFGSVDILFAPILAGPTPTIAETNFNDQDMSNGCSPAPPASRASPTISARRPCRCPAASLSMGSRRPSSSTARPSAKPACSPPPTPTRALPTTIPGPPNSTDSESELYQGYGVMRGGRRALREGQRTGEIAHRPVGEEGHGTQVAYLRIRADLVGAVDRSEGDLLLVQPFHPVRARTGREDICQRFREVLVALDSPADRIGPMREVIARSQAARPLRRASSNRASSPTPWSRFTGSWFMRSGETWKRRGLSMVGRLSVRL